MTYSAGDTFLLKEPGSPKSHLYIILCRLTGSTDTFLAVPLNTVTIYTDNTLILTEGDHPFIHHSTAVSYDRMREIEEAKLAELERLSKLSDDPIFSRHSPCNPELIARVQQGALASDMAAGKFVNKLTAYLNED